MKKSKTILSLFFAAAMAFSPLTIYAEGSASTDQAGTGSITILNPQEKDGTASSYNAYKIFDVSYSGGENNNHDNYSYQISADSPWLSTVQAYSSTETNGLKLEAVKTAGSSTAVAYNITFEEEGDNKFSAASFAKYLKEHIPTDAEKTALTEDKADGKKVMKAEDLSLGYYLVTTTSGALCDLTTTDNTVEILDKNDWPDLTKEIVDPRTGKDENTKGASFDTGDVVGFKLTSQVPVMEGYESYTYQLEDTMSSNLAIVKDDNGIPVLTVKIGEEELPASAKQENGSTDDYKMYEYGTKDGEKFIPSYTVKYYSDAKDSIKANTIVVDIVDFVQYNSKATEDVVFNYSATLLADAKTTDVETNVAKLHYSSDPTTNDLSVIEAEPTQLYDFDIKVNKFTQNAEDKEATPSPLAGAVFALYRKENGKKEYYVEAEDGTVDWTEGDPTAANTLVTTYTTDASGNVSFKGLKADVTYYLQEVKAPDGYNRLTNDVPVTIDGQYGEDGILADTTQEKEEDGTCAYIGEENDKQTMLVISGGKGTAGEQGTQYVVTVPVENNKGQKMPETGGNGTMLLIAAGGVLIALSLVSGITRRRVADRS